MEESVLAGLRARIREYNENVWQGVSRRLLAVQREALIDDIAGSFDLPRVTAEFRFWRIAEDILHNEM